MSARGGTTGLRLAGPARLAALALTTLGILAAVGLTAIVFTVHRHDPAAQAAVAFLGLLLVGSLGLSAVELWRAPSPSHHTEPAAPAGATR